AARFRCDVYLEKDEQEVNGKSIMGVLMLAATKGSTVNVRTEGDDAVEALTAIGDIFRDGFGEDH
ncbi:MAG: HPr family phosphocarrier protein, partial [Myxococcaceae bacterium]|nr:HPr family phosphocarrier protein [Myxococcaceae bacterium]